MTAIEITVCAKVPLGEWKAGSPTHLHEFLSGLSERAHVKAYVPYVSGGYRSEGFEIRETGSRLSNAALNMYHFSTSAQLKLLGDRQDVVHWRLDLAQELILLKALKCLKVCEVNGPLLEEQAEMRKMPGPVYWAACNELKRNLKIFDRVVVVSDELKELLIKNYGVPAEKVRIVYNGVNTSLFRAGRYRDEAMEIRTRMGIGDKKVLGFVGGLRPWHGVQSAIMMMSALKRYRDDTVLCILGSGREFSNLKAMIKGLGIDDCIFMPGSVPYTEVPKYVEMFDIALAPYPSKGVSNYFNPLKLFEYMSMKKPVICGNTSWSHRFLGGDRGVIVDCEDALSFAAAVSSLLDDTGRSRLLAENAMKSVLSDFTWERNVEKMLKVYQSAMN